MSIPQPPQPRDPLTGPLEKAPPKPPVGPEWTLYKVEGGKCFYRNRSGQIMVR